MARAGRTAASGRGGFGVCGNDRSAESETGASRHMKRDWARDYRLASSPLRVFPDFVIPGEAKCGTTSLYRYLTQHPDILPADRKEPRNFLEHPGSGLSCRSHYPLAIRRYLHIATRGRRFITGEATAEYLSRSWMPRAIKAMIPGIKVVVLLRNPVTRAVSDYQMLVRNGVISTPFEEVVDRATSWLRDERTADLVDAAAESEHFYGRVVLRGLYARNMERWLSVFGREKILILKSEAFFSDPQQTVNRVFSFLDVESCEVNTERIGRKGNYAGEIAPSVLEQLGRLYRPYNERLYELIGADFNWDCESFS